MALPYEHAKSAQRLYWPAEAPPFFERWTRPRDIDDHDLLCAEMSRLAYAERDQVNAALMGLGFTQRLWFGGPRAKVRRATHGADGFIATRDDVPLTILAFRGTQSDKLEDILSDAMTTAEPYPAGGRVHEGFARGYAAVRDTIRPVLRAQTGPVLITGHSLGAGLATLAAADHLDRSPALITFGSPRVGDAAFARLLAGPTVHRFVDCCDVVTRIPPERFKEREIEQFLDELIPESLLDGPLVKVLVGEAARLIERAFQVVAGDLTYLHVGDADYHDRDGKRLGEATTAAIADDQQTARRAYKGGVVPSPRQFPERLRELLTALKADHTVVGVRNAVSSFVAKLLQADPVPLRDLADHAPLNYVSLFTGRK
jgi:pimeloyl-ACP methyl ester carboxylesterase